MVNIAQAEGSCHRIEVISLIGIGLVKAFGAYFETQTFHGFVNKAGALKCFQLQITNGIVALLVVNIH